MAKFPTIPENPTNADLALGLMQLHECVEAGKDVYGSGLASAKLERQALRAGQLNMARQIKSVKEIQKTVVTQLDVAAKAASDAKTTAESVETKVDSILEFAKQLRKSFWQGVGAIIVALIIGCIGLGFQAIGNHTNTIHTIAGVPK